MILGHYQVYYIGEKVTCQSCLDICFPQFPKGLKIFAKRDVKRCFWRDISVAGVNTTSDRLPRYKHCVLAPVL